MTLTQDRMGLLQVSAINAAMAALMKTLTAFTKEKVIVNRERASGSYAMFPYLAAKLAAELPVGGGVHSLHNVNLNLSVFTPFSTNVTEKSTYFPLSQALS